MGAAGNLHMQFRELNRFYLHFNLELERVHSTCAFNVLALFLHDITKSFILSEWVSRGVFMNSCTST